MQVIYAASDARPRGISKLIMLIATLVLAVGVSGFVAPASAEAITQSEVTAKLNSIVSQNVGTYWTTDGKPCVSSSNCHSKYYYGSQCKGFAGWVFNQVFGTGYIGAYSSDKSYIPSPSGATQLARCSIGTVNAGAVQGAFSNAAPGDFIQMRRAGKSWGHSMILLSVESGGIIVIECNDDGHCGVHKNYHSWSSFASKNSGFSIYRANGYIPTPSLPFRCDINAPSDGASFNGSLNVSGWAIGSTAPTNVVYSINGGEEKQLTLYTRDDVVNAWPAYPKANDAWLGNIPNSEFKYGKNTITFTAIFAGWDRHVIGARTVNNTNSGSGPRISGVEVSDISSAGYTVSCTVTAPNGIAKVQFPTWSHADWQDDLVWHNVNASGTSARVSYTVKTSEHRDDRGLYSTHIYVTDKPGNQAASGVASNVLVPSAVSSMGSSTYYLVDANVLSGTWNDTQKVVAASYQGKCGGYLATITSAAENATIAELIKKGSKNYYWLGLTDAASEGTWTWVTGEPLTYTNWYSPNPNGGAEENWGLIWKSNGQWQDMPVDGAAHSVQNMGFVVEVPGDNGDAKISDALITGVDAEGFTVSAHVSSSAGVSKAAVAAWTDANGADDLVVGDAVVEDGVASYRVSIADHDGNRGPYRCEVRLQDGAGNMVVSPVKGGGLISVPTQTASYGGHMYYLCEAPVGINDARRLAAAFLDGTAINAKRTYLASITSDEEQSVVATLAAAGADSSWIGLSADITQDDAYFWDNGDTCSYTNWGTSQPNVAGGKYWVQIAGSDGSWKTVDSDENASFIVEADLSAVEKPVAMTGLVYDGSKQSAVAVSNAYTLSGAISAKNAGEYTATAHLVDGYTWSDGTIDDVAIEWSIAKAEGNAVQAADIAFTYDGADHEIDEPQVAKDGSTVLYGFDGEHWTTVKPYFISAGEYTLYVKAVNPNYADTDPIEVSVEVEKAKLTATYVSETVAFGGTPVGKVVVTGFAESDAFGDVPTSGEDEDEWMVDGYVEPAVVLPDALEANKSYQITPQGGEANDYEFVYVSGTLSVGVDKSALQSAITQAQEALERYRVSADGTDVPSDEKWVTQSQVDSLNSSIAMAQVLLSSDDAALVSNGASMLQVATSSFEASAKSGTKPAEVAKPSVKQGQRFAYDGSAHSPSLPDDVRFLVSGTASATDAGTYHASIAPATGYVWTGGSDDAIDVEWSIVPVAPSLSLASDRTSVTVGSTAKVIVSYDGDGELSAVSDDPSVATASYSDGALTVVAQAVGQTTVRMSAAAGQNYAASEEVELAVDVQTLVVRIAKPAAADFTFDGASHSGVAASASYALYGTQAAVDAGSYQTVAVLRDGYAWEDGTSGMVVIGWSIAKAQPTLALGDAQMALRIGDSEKATISYSGDGTLVAVSSDPSVARASIADGNLVVSAQELGSATVTILADEGRNFLAAVPQSIEVTVEEALNEDEQVGAAVTREIASLPALDELALGDAGAVKHARASYDGLTSAQRAYVGNLPALEAAESRIAQLQAAADKEAADREAASRVDSAISSLPEPERMLLEDKGDVEAARASYDALTPGQKGYVTKLATLEAAEDRIAELQAAADKENPSDAPKPSAPGDAQTPSQPAQQQGGGSPKPSSPGDAQAQTQPAQQQGGDSSGQGDRGQAGQGSVAQPASDGGQLAAGEIGGGLPQAGRQDAPQQGSDDGSGQAKPDEPAGKIMHRLYNPWSGEHFYTSDDGEFAGLVELGWSDEGTGWNAPEVSDTPVYRMYNPYAGEHHYCMDAAERDALLGAGWVDEGVGWYSDDARTVPLYREYNPYEFSNNHNYTTDPDEHAALVSLGWVDEGYAWYGV